MDIEDLFNQEYVPESSELEKWSTKVSSPLSCVVVLEIGKPYSNRELQKDFVDFTFHHFFLAFDHVQDYFYNNVNTCMKERSTQYRPEIIGKLEEIVNFLRPFHPNVKCYIKEEDQFLEYIVELNFVQECPNEVIL